MGDVLKFRLGPTGKDEVEDNPAIVYECGVCGGQTFFLRVEGYCECADCESFLQEVVCEERLW